MSHGNCVPFAVLFDGVKINYLLTYVLTYLLKCKYFEIDKVNIFNLHF